MATAPSRVGSARRAFAPWADPAAQPLVRFENVAKRFGPVTAVSGLSLDIYPGEFFALLGPSGCGKTTLMRMLAGFEPPNEGRVLLAGEDLAGIPPYRRPVNMMFQSYALFPHLDVERNVAFGLKQEGLPAEEIEARVAEMLALVQLSAQARRKPDQLSGGQRQRVALARSLAKRPKVLLLDEPLAALDKKLREETQFELMDLQARLGTTFIIVTHDQEEAMTVADRIAVMDHGRLAQVGPPAEIYEQPNSRYVASFVGDVNLIEARVKAVYPSFVQVETAGGRQWRIAQPVATAPGATVWLALRPEKLVLTGTAPPAAENSLAGEVADVGYLGDVSIYKVRTAEGTIKAAMMNTRHAVERPIGPGDEVWLGFAPDAGSVLTQ